MSACRNVAVRCAGRGRRLGVSVSEMTRNFLGCSLKKNEHYIQRCAERLCIWGKRVTLAWRRTDRRFKNTW